MMMLRPLIAACAVSCFVPGSAFAAPEIGQPAPIFEAVAADGSNVSLTDLRGKTVVLEWTNDGCPFVQKHYNSGNMQQTQATAVEGGAVWFQVISSAPGTQGHADAARAMALNEQRNVTDVTNVLLDEEGAVARAYGAQVTPHLYIIDGEGALQYMGAIDSIPTGRTEDIAEATNYVVEALTAMQAGEAVPNPVTRPYGCTVKYAS